jgi:hypothetical protein
VIHGWKTPLPLTAADAVRALEPFCDEFCARTSAAKD